jgi:hypothetical protein
MNPWEQQVWDPRSTEIPAYERLCRKAQKQGLHVELRLSRDGLSDIRLSNGMSEDLHGLDDRDRAASVLLSYLAREVSR